MSRAKRLVEIRPAAIARFKAWRLARMRHRGRRSRPAIVNRELACLKHRFNVARKGLIELKGGIPSENPVSALSFFHEQNVRDRVLTPDEFQRMVQVSMGHLKPVLLWAHHTGKWRGEILSLTWDRGDRKAGIIWLKEIDPKACEGRFIPIGCERGEVLRRLSIALDGRGHLWTPGARPGSSNSLNPRKPLVPEWWNW